MVTDTPVIGWAFLARPGFQPIGKLLVTLAIAAVFALDCLTPLGFGISFLYVPILWVAMPWSSPRQISNILVACSMLTVAGLFLSPESDIRLGLSNRSIALTALWFMGYSGMAYRKTVDLLSERERELTGFVENAPVGIHWIAPDGTILWANRNEIGMLGYGREEYVGRNIAGFHVDRDEAKDILGKLDANVTLKDYAARLRHKDGSIRHMLISYHACQEDGRFTHSRCFMRDITDRKCAEQALNESKSRLRMAFEDRERLSRDLHDNTIQAIYAIGMQLETCRRLPRDDPEGVADRQLAHAIHGLNGVIRDVRGYITGPGPQGLHRPGLHAELASLVETMGATGTLRFRLKVDSWAITRLTPSQAEHVLHIAREALSNSLRHSHASRAWLVLQGTDTSVQIKIHDDGVGFDPALARQHAFGLQNMESRARQMGSRLEILSLPGHGTTLVLHIPNEAQINDDIH